MAVASTPIVLSVNSSWNLIGSICAMAQDLMGYNLWDMKEGSWQCIARVARSVVDHDRFRGGRVDTRLCGIIRLVV